MAEEFSDKVLTEILAYRFEGGHFFWDVAARCRPDGDPPYTIMLFCGWKPQLPDFEEVLFWQNIGQCWDPQKNTGHRLANRALRRSRAYQADVSLMTERVVNFRQAEKITELANYLPRITWVHVGKYMHYDRINPGYWT